MTLYDVFAYIVEFEKRLMTPSATSFAKLLFIKYRNFVFNMYAYITRKRLWLMIIETNDNFRCISINVLMLEYSFR